MASRWIPWNAECLQPFDLEKTLRNYERSRILIETSWYLPQFQSRPKFCNNHEIQRRGLFDATWTKTNKSPSQFSRLLSWFNPISINEIRCSWRGGASVKKRSVVRDARVSFVCVTRTRLVDGMMRLGSNRWKHPLKKRRRRRSGQVERPRSD